MNKIKGPSRSRVSIRPRAVRASLTRHYEQEVQEDLDWDIRPPEVSRARVEGA